MIWDILIIGAVIYGIAKLWDSYKGREEVDKRIKVFVIFWVISFVILMILILLDVIPINT